MRYDAAGQQTGKPGERRGPDTLVSEKITWRVQQEVRGTLNYTQKVRGAVASNMPDRNNEQRYDSWISRSGRAGNPAWMKIDSEEVMDSAVRLGKADGEGAGELNRERAGKFGRVEHLRTRITLAGEGPGAAKFNDPFMQIDRVDGKLHFEPPAIEFDPAQVRTVVEKVVRMDKPAAAGEWDSSGAKAQRTTAQLSLPLLPVQVFDMPRDAQSFEATRTVDVPGPTGGKATITIALRRTGAAAAGGSARAHGSGRWTRQRGGRNVHRSPAHRSPDLSRPHRGPRQTQLPAHYRGQRSHGRCCRRRGGRWQGARRRLRTTGRLGHWWVLWRCRRRYATRRDCRTGLPALTHRNERLPAKARTTHAMGTGTWCRCHARRGGDDRHAMGREPDRT